MIWKLEVYAGLLALAAGCSHGVQSDSGTPQAQDAGLLGEFEDDYANRYTITATEWFQHPRSRYRIVKWHPTDRYLIAQNDPANPSGGGLWTRIDWLGLSGMPPYTWGFCLSAYAAASPAAAESTAVAQRSTPLTGCGGFPFSRMRRLNR